MEDEEEKDESEVNDDVSDDVSYGEEELRDEGMEGMLNHERDLESSNEEDEYGEEYNEEDYNDEYDEEYSEEYNEEEYNDEYEEEYSERSESLVDRSFNKQGKQEGFGFLNPNVERLPDVEVEKRGDLMGEDGFFLRDSGSMNDDLIGEEEEDCAFEDSEPRFIESCLRDGDSRTNEHDLDPNWRDISLSVQDEISHAKDEIVHLFQERVASEQHTPSSLILPSTLSTSSPTTSPSPTASSKTQLRQLGRVGGRSMNPVDIKERMRQRSLDAKTRIEATIRAESVERRKIEDEKLGFEAEKEFRSSRLALFSKSSNPDDAEKELRVSRRSLFEKEIAEAMKGHDDIEPSQPPVHSRIETERELRSSRLALLEQQVSEAMKGHDEDVIEFKNNDNPISYGNKKLQEIREHIRQSHLTFENRRLETVNKVKEEASSTILLDHSFLPSLEHMNQQHDVTHNNSSNANDDDSYERVSIHNSQQQTKNNENRENNQIRDDDSALSYDYDPRDNKRSDAPEQTETNAPESTINNVKQHTIHKASDSFLDQSLPASDDTINHQEHISVSLLPPSPPPSSPPPSRNLFLNDQYHNPLEEYMKQQPHRHRHTKFTSLFAFESEPSEQNLSHDELSSYKEFSHDELSSYKELSHGDNSSYKSLSYGDNSSYRNADNIYQDEREHLYSSHQHEEDEDHKEQELVYQDNETERYKEDIEVEAKATSFVKNKKSSE